ncbi:MAG: co-chaperone DjlA [Gammaproteobacteria bacterium]|nr:co-chaperone DjlA [Gammaproteobacteria bacterium]
MGWNGKIIGGALGLLALGPLGGLLGALLGHQFDTATARPVTPEAAAARINALFFPATFRLMGHIAKADGRVSEREIAAARAIMHSLRLGSDQMQRAIEYYTEGKRPGFDAERAVRELRSALWGQPQLAYFFMEIQLHAAMAGNGLGDLPRQRLRHIAMQLGIPPPDYAQLEALARWRTGARPAGPGAAAPQIAEAYRVLEVEPAASDEQVIKAYRRQMSRHHPDKLQANGVPESMLEHAKERTQQIRAAYELIRTQRGMS